MMREAFAASAELKFSGAPDAGELEGYGSVFNVLDSYGDLIVPGAFDATLAEHKSKGTMPHMFGEHSAFMIGGDPYPIGIWTDIEPDEKGLKMKGRLVGLAHPDVARVRDLVQAGALGAMSIAWRGREGGVTRGKKAGEPNRTLTAVDLFSVDLVADPANPHARIEGMKAMMTTPNTTAAANSMQAAHDMCVQCMSGGDAPTADERNQIVGHLRDGYKSLTGNDMPAMSMMSAKPTIREFEQWMKREFHLSNSEARSFAERLFKPSATPRDGDAGTKEALREIASAFSGFTLPKFGD
jgi:hypothetical protein